MNRHAYAHLEPTSHICQPGATSPGPRPALPSHRRCARMNRHASGVTAGRMLSARAGQSCDVMLP